MRAPPDVVRVLVDGAKCDGHGICALILPERISLDAWGYASVESDPINSRRTLARAKRAVAACPVQSSLANRFGGRCSTASPRS